MYIRKASRIQVVSGSPLPANVKLFCLDGTLVDDVVGTETTVFGRRLPRRSLDRENETVHQFQPLCEEVCFQTEWPVIDAIQLQQQLTIKFRM